MTIAFCSDVPSFVFKLLVCAWHNTRRVVKRVLTLAVFQCEFAAPSPKPTRFLTSLDPSDVGYRGLHKLDGEGNYLGPLPKHCPHGPQAHKPLVGKDEQGRWMTAPSAIYPPELCKWIASIAWPALLRLRGGKQGQTMGSNSSRSSPLPPRCKRCK